MRICLRPSFQCFLILLVLSGMAECIFFQLPRRALMTFLETLGGGHKPEKPIHHYHMHYYPVPILLPKPVPPPPPKIEIDLSSLHSDHNQLRSFGWGDYNKIHEPEIIVPSSNPESWVSPLPEPWPDTALTQQKSWSWDNNEILEKDHAYKEAKPPGILLQVPLHQQIVLYQPPAKDTKSTLLSTLFKKIRRINEALFHPEEEDCHDQHHDNKPHITNSLTYAATS